MLTTPISLALRDGPPILALERLTVGSAVVRLHETLTSGRWVVADLLHPAFTAPLSTAARISWSQQIAPGLPLSLAGLEFTGTWEALGGLRRAILGVVAAQALVPEGQVGFVTPEPDGSWTCHSAQTVKVAMIAASAAGGFTVRRRDGRDPAGIVLSATTFADALAQAFDRAEAPRLEPSIGPLGAPSATPTQTQPAKQAPTKARPAAATPAPPPKRSAAAAYEDAVLASRTVVIAPERPPPRDLSDPGEDAILGANTLVVAPERPRSASSEEDEILASRTIIHDDRPPSADPDRTVVLGKDAAGPPGRRGDPPTKSQKRWSRVLAGGVQVGWIAPDTPSAWSTYDDRGRKTAVISAEEGVVRVCWLGDQATESFEYFEAPTAKEAIVVAFELTNEPTIDPPLAGLF